mmetsp:Transcript_39295/g.118194  ORF Transcript_39295/g.118194 Transcript_39295/m.118194 type:complete len:158 (-) Transcript_39295:177-650(-)|eukprot:CAMPEP_0113543100 /NCGR_PEP_ID=MMETSP0015_2-20120614/9977_1 /TAXON_ID=2838 /ORGANISM="Odontella" /LENGTH=157 /DNA_ID=CAMNT_0000443235 /DNA_START=68 /DNA_END=541 /DNA_ORIENTATION=+ /assembly_acc=CAM_ASM_000160
MIKHLPLLAIALLLSPDGGRALVQPNNSRCTRRSAVSGWIAAAAGTAAASGFGLLGTVAAPGAASAAEDNRVLSDEEMEARVARKMELLQSGKGPRGPRGGKATDIRSDVNPEAAENLRSRSALENARIAMDKQNELKNRDKAQKRDDLCEMLGRGC